MSGLRERKKSQLRQKIRETTIALVRERGIDAVTIEAIVQRCDVSQPTFYNYFPSKEAILAEHASRGWGPMLSNMADGGDPVPHRLSAYFQAVAEDIERDAVLWGAIATSNVYNPISNPELLTSEGAGTRVLESVLEEGQRRGELTQDTPARLMASALEGLMMRAVIEWAARFPAPRALSERMGEMFEFFLRASASPVERAARRAKRPASSRSGAAVRRQR